MLFEAVVVRTAKEIRRPDGSHIKFDDNSAVMINSKVNRWDQNFWTCGERIEGKKLYEDYFTGPRGSLIELIS